MRVSEFRGFRPYTFRRTGTWLHDAQWEGLSVLFKLACGRSRGTQIQYCTVLDIPLTNHVVGFLPPIDIPR